MGATVELADYLFTRLSQLGLKSIHGVPGDYNLELLDHVEPQGLHWVGNCNELNAGYAADGYARAKGGIGALITTFGVGELSATNAIAGAYVELAPVVHIVGTPARHLQESRALIHHTFNDGNYRRFADMAAHVTVAQANLCDPQTCPEQIDAILQQCLIHSRPVYVQVPVDMVSISVASDRLQAKINLPSRVFTEHNERAITQILDRIYTCEMPMLLVDGESRAYDISAELHSLIDLTQWPVWTSVFGKSIIDESLPTFRGVWKGNWATPSDKDIVKSRDLILCFGAHFSGTNTYGYSSIPDPAITIHFAQFSVKTNTESFRDIPCKHLLQALLKNLDPSKLRPVTPLPAIIEAPTSEVVSDEAITQDGFYRVLNTHFQEGDFILAETGTAGHGCRNFRLPSHTQLFKPSTWLSIGYMLPAAQGAALAQREMYEAGVWYQGNHPRTILLIGDGSFQMTAQEISTIIRNRLNVTVVLINNDGYTIERCLHGRTQPYNDIAAWQYLRAPEFFGGHKEQHGYQIQTFLVKTWGELNDALSDLGLNSGEGLRMIEVVMDREDAPVGSLRESLENQRKDL